MTIPSRQFPTGVTTSSDHSASSTRNDLRNRFQDNMAADREAGRAAKDNGSVAQQALDKVNALEKYIHAWEAAFVTRVVALCLAASYLCIVFLIAAYVFADQFCELVRETMNHILNHIYVRAKRPWWWPAVTWLGYYVQFVHLVTGLVGTYRFMKWLVTPQDQGLVA